ncbi:MAG: hypothetical protein ACXVYV_03310 [Gaiellales bacterium]
MSPVPLRRTAVLPLVCALVAAGVALLVLTVITPGGDAPSHLFQTWLFRHRGFGIWNNYWYAGRYEFVTYSVLYYPLAALMGQLAVLVPSSAVLGAAFAAVCRREWGSAARGPSLAFAATAPGAMLISGVYPFSLAATLAVVSLFLVQRRMRVSFALAVLATLATSPLAFAFLLALLAGALLGRRHPGRTLRANRFALATVLGAFLAGVFMQRAFPTQGWYPYDPADAGIVLFFSLAGLYITGSSPRARSLRMLFAAYLALNLIAFLLQGPIGANTSRLFAIAGAPMLWLAANVGRQRSRLVIVPVLMVAVFIQVGAKVRDAYSAWEAPSASVGYWQPALRFLRTHADRQHRVEAVSTSSHWDAYYLARAGVPLARGWYRQDDFPQNAALYDDLTAASFQRWLRSMGVRYVLLPDAPLDYSSTAEARLLRSGRSGLVEVGHTHHWRFFELPDATPIVTAPAGRRAELISLSTERVWIWVSGPGRYAVRLRYSPYLTATAPACVSPGPDGMSAVNTVSAGFVRLDVSAGVSTMASTVSDSGSSC